jgi:hypothetical protein
LRQRDLFVPFDSEQLHGHKEISSDEIGDVSSR